MGTPPTFIRLGCLILSGFCLLTAPGGMYIAATTGRWYMLAFEVIVLIASITGVLTGLGRLKSGPAMSMFATGGVVGVCAVLSEPNFVSRVVQGGGGQTSAGFNLVPWIVARVLVGGGLVGLAGLTLLLRRARVSLPLLVKGVLLGLPVVCGAGAMLVPSVRAAVQSLSMVQSALLVVFGCFLVGALVSLSGHCLIRAFEVGVEDGSATPA